MWRWVVQWFLSHSRREKQNREEYAAAKKTLQQMSVDVSSIDESISVIKETLLQFEETFASVSFMAMRFREELEAVLMGMNDRDSGATLTPCDTHVEAAKNGNEDYVASLFTFLAQLQQKRLNLRERVYGMEVKLRFLEEERRCAVRSIETLRECLQRGYAVPCEGTGTIIASEGEDDEDDVVDCRGLPVCSFPVSVKIIEEYREKE